MMQWKGIEVSVYLIKIPSVSLLCIFVLFRHRWGLSCLDTCWRFVLSGVLKLSGT